MPGRASMRSGNTDQCRHKCLSLLKKAGYPAEQALIKYI